MAGQVILYFDDQADALRFALAAGSVMAGENANESFTGLIVCFASFFCRECTFRENSPEVFLSVLHHHENQIHARKLTAPAGQQAEKIWMIKLRGAQQKRDLGIRLRATTHEFNGEIFRWLVAGLR